jgi:hypothetical protein
VRLYLQLGSQHTLHFKTVSAVRLFRTPLWRTGLPLDFRFTAECRTTLRYHYEARRFVGLQVPHAELNRGVPRHNYLETSDRYRTWKVSPLLCAGAQKRSHDLGAVLCTRTDGWTDGRMDGRTDGTVGANAWFCNTFNDVANWCLPLFISVECRQVLLTSR